MHPAGVVCSGNVVLDILVRPVDQMRWGATTLVDSIAQSLGGNGSNTSYTLGMLGVPVRLLASIGCDPFGDFVLQRLSSAGVDTSRIRRSPEPTATTIGVVNSGGDRLFLHRLGCSAGTYFDAIDLLAAIPAGTQYYHLASPFGLPKLRAVQPDLLRAARGAGLITSIDTHWDSQDRWMDDLGLCLPHTDILFANEDEIRMLTGTADPPLAAAILRERGARTVVAKLSSRGSMVFSSDGVIAVPAFNVVPLDTTGAGDCFAGGYLAALARGRPHEEAARFANAVAAMSIQQLGAVDGVRGWDETQAWMASTPLRPRLGNNETEPRP